MQPVSRGSLALEGDRLGEATVTGDVLAAETNSNATQFILVKATEDGTSDVPADYTCPVEEANFEYPRTKQAIRAALLRPVTTGKGEASVTRYEEHPNAPPLLVPCSNLRIGKIPMKSRDAPRRVAPARVAHAGAAAAPPPAVFELPATIRAHILERCGVY